MLCGHLQATPRNVVIGLYYLAQEIVIGGEQMLCL